MTLHLSATLALSFVTPAMFAAGLLVGLPVLAHLLHRRAKRAVVFPSIDLLVETRAARSSLYRLRRWLLLAVRCLAVLLLVAAFARPVIHADRQTAGRPGAAATVAMVIDRSASTGRIAGGVSAMQALRSAAGAELDALAAGLDRVQVIWADAQPTRAFAQPTANLGFVRETLERAEPTPERADLRAAIALAGEVLAEAAGPRRLVIVSDLQAANWAEVDAAAFDAVPEAASVALAAFDAADAANLTLNELRCEPAIPVRGRPLIVTAEVANHGTAVRRVDVRLTVDGRPHGRSTVSLDADATGEAVFRLDPSRPGSLQLSAALPDDALAADNARHAVVEVVDRLPVLIASDDSPDEPGSASFFLTRALAPRGDARDRYAVTHRTPGELGPGDPAGAALVVIGRLTATPSDAAMRALGDHLRGGGSVLWFAGDAGSLQPMRRLADAAATESAEATEATGGPAAPVAVPASTAAGGIRRIAEGDWRHPLLDRFAGDVRPALERVTFSPPPGGSAMRAGHGGEVLLSFDDGAPALILGRVGEGRLVVAGFSPALDHSDFATHGCFVTFVHGLTEALRPQRRTGRDHRVGHPLMLRAGDADRDGPLPKVLDPAGEAVVDAMITGDAGVTATVPRTARPGVYRFEQAGATLAAAAVNVDPREGDPARLDPALIRQRLDDAGARVAVSAEAAGERPLRGTPVWGVLAALAAGALAVEMALTAWWRR